MVISVVSKTMIFLYFIKANKYGGRKFILTTSIYGLKTSSGGKSDFGFLTNELEICRFTVLKKVSVTYWIWDLVLRRGSVEPCCF